MSSLKMPGKGKAALLLSELNAEHAPKQETAKETNVTTLQETNEDSQQDSIEESNEATTERSQARAAAERPDSPRPRPAPPARKSRDTAPPPEGRAERLTRALQFAGEDEITVVTVRVSARLNEYMDRYVERLNRIQPKRRYRKQDAIAEAFAAFFADHPLPPAPSEEEL